MTSAEAYISRVYSGIIKRASIIEDLRRQKAVIDDKVLRGYNFVSPDISILREIIGADTLFRKAEKRNKYTLRHMCFKTSKSLEKIAKEDGKIFLFLKDLKNFAPEAEKALRPTVLLMLSNNVNYVKFLTSLDEIYKNQYYALNNALAADQVRIYKYQLRQESELMEKYKGYFEQGKKAVELLSKHIGKYHKSLLKKAFKWSNIYSLVIFGMFFGYAVTAYLMFSLDKTDPSYNKKLDFVVLLVKCMTILTLSGIMTLTRMQKDRFARKLEIFTSKFLP